MKPTPFRSHANGAYSRSVISERSESELWSLMQMLTDSLDVAEADSAPSGAVLSPIRSSTKPAPSLCQQTTTIDQTRFLPDSFFPLISFALSLTATFGIPPEARTQQTLLPSPIRHFPLLIALQEPVFPPSYTHAPIAWQLTFHHIQAVHPTRRFNRASQKKGSQSK